MKSEDGPHEPRKSGLKNGNPSGDPNSAPRCGAKTRLGTSCLAPAIRGKARCLFHGGRSTGPRTPEGLDRCQTSAWKTGHYSAEAKASRRQVRELMMSFSKLKSDMEDVS